MPSGLPVFLTAASDYKEANGIREIAAKWETRLCCELNFYWVVYESILKVIIFMLCIKYFYGFQFSSRYLRDM